MGVFEWSGEPRAKRVLKRAAAWFTAIAVIGAGAGTAVSAATGVSTEVTLRDGGVVATASIIDIQQDGKNAGCDVTFDDSRGIAYEVWLDDQCPARDGSRTRSRERVVRARP